MALSIPPRPSSLAKPSRHSVPSGLASSRPAGPAPSRRHGVGFWTIALAFLCATAFSTVPTPLYPLYMARDHFSTFMVTVVFAIYAVGVMVSLLLAGHVSDWIGRKKVFIAALVLELVAAGLFLAAPSLPVILAARLVTGLGVGMVAATATAHLQELHLAHRPGASRQRFEIVSTAANIGGLGIGPLVTGYLAQYVQAPLRVPYLVFAVLLMAAIAAVARTPETVRAPAVRPAYRPQRITADAGGPANRAGYLVAAAAAFAAFSMYGVFSSIAPGFVATELHQPSRVLAGATVFAVFGGSALAQTLTGGLGDRAKLVLGLASEAAGVLTLLLGMRTAGLPAFLLGGVLAGVGSGILFKAAVGAVAGMAAPASRSEALAGLFLVAYLGLSVPAVAVGTATRFVSPVTAMTWFAGILLALLCGVAALSRRAGR
jgi:MFS family permease